MTIKAIETRYAGCRFRSRLEARWAVFFDNLGIKWQYEPQGLNVSYRLTRCGEGTFNYLPDFYLPDFGVWAEVKGSLADDELLRLLDAAASLSSNDGGGCHDSGGRDMVVLGPIPGLGAFGAFGPDRVPWLLHMHKGDLLASPWLGDDSSPCTGHLVAADTGGDVLNGCPASHTARVLLDGTHAVAPHVRAAYTAARSARFEHGEAG